MVFTEQFSPVTSGRERSIGVFDSGVGGISVLKEMCTLMPNERYWYFGDSANAPYGTKSAEQVRERTLACLSRMVEGGAKALVIACNTATAAAVNASREAFSVPVISMEPEIKTPIVTKHRRTLVMATPMTLQLERVQQLIKRHEGVTELILLPCPGLADLVEAGKTDAPETRAYLQAILQPFIEKPVESIVLGCTHYPHLKPLIRGILGNGLPIYDGGAGTARELKRRLTELGLLSSTNRPGEILFENSMPGTGMTDLSRVLYLRYEPTIPAALQTN